MLQGSQSSEVPPQGDHAPNMKGGNEVLELTNQKIRVALLTLTQAMTTPINLNMRPRVLDITMASMLRDLVREGMLYGYAT